jgi:hypothetical protein
MISDVMNIPTIRLEVERMKQTILNALPEHAAVMDAMVMAAIEAYCTPEKLGSIVRLAATEALNDAVKEEVRDFFQYSKPGRQAVREAVIEYLNEWEKYHALDSPGDKDA